MYLVCVDVTDKGGRVIGDPSYPIAGKYSPDCISTSAHQMGITFKLLSCSWPYRERYHVKSCTVTDQLWGNPIYFAFDQNIFIFNEVFRFWPMLFLSIKNLKNKTNGQS